jgi:hypothetical protein
LLGAAALLLAAAGKAGWPLGCRLACRQQSRMQPIQIFPLSPLRSCIVTKANEHIGIVERRDETFLDLPAVAIAINDLAADIVFLWFDHDHVLLGAFRLESPHHDQHRRVLLEFLRRFLDGVGFVDRLDFTKPYSFWDGWVDVKNGVNRIRFEISYE